MKKKANTKPVKKKRVYSKVKHYVHAHKGVLPTCKSCKVEGHDHDKDNGNMHRFHKTPQNPHPFCNTHFSLQNHDVVSYCSDKPYWKSLRRKKIAIGTLKPRRRYNV